jgi:hypothetical protein
MLIPAPAMFWALVDVDHFIDRSAVNPHPQRDRRMCFQSADNLQSALRRRFGISQKNKRHPVPGWKSNQFFPGLSLAKFVRSGNDFVKLAQQFTLLVHQQLRVAHHVDEQDVPDL